MVNKLTVTFDHTLNLRVGKSLTVIDSHLTVDFDFAKTIDCCDYSAKMVADVPVMFLHNSVSLTPFLNRPKFRILNLSGQRASRISHHNTLQLLLSSI